MEIHELNTFTGTLGASDYFATDNGTDTSKVSASEMFGPLNARIDNIITSPAPTEQEIIDARQGVDGTVYTSLGDAIRSQVSDLEGTIEPLGKVSVTLRDGFLASGNGAVYPATADGQKYSDFIPVTIGTKVDVSYTLSAAKYRNIGLHGYAEDKTWVARLAYAEGGAYSTVKLSTTIDDASVKYIRFSFSAYNVLTSCDVYTYINGSEILRDTEAKIDKIKDLDNIRFQYINSSAWESGYYYNWNSGHTTLVKNSTSSNWHTQKVNYLPAGIYHYNNFCTLAFSFIENVSTGEIHSLSDIGVVETNNGTVTIGYDFNLYLTINTTYFDKDVAMFADGNLPGEYVYGEYKDGSDSFYVNAQGQTVWIVGNGYMPTIQSACDAASSNDIIFIRCGVYTEQVSIWNKKLHLIGENKANTILIDHSGNYNTPPLEMSLGSLSNMTIIEDGSSPTGAGTSAYMMAYCLHIEWTPPANEVFKIDNCDFINYVHAPLGCGLYQDYTVHFKDCTFRCEATNEGANERGSFYFHSNIQPNVTGQKIIAENCIISSAGENWTVLLGVPSGANNSGNAVARFSNCCIWNDNLGTADSIAHFDTSGGADVLKVENSYGNTVDILHN